MLIISERAKIIACLYFFTYCHINKIRRNLPNDEIRTYGRYTNKVFIKFVRRAIKLASAHVKGFYIFKGVSKKVSKKILLLTNKNERMSPEFFLIGIEDVTEIVTHADNKSMFICLKSKVPNSKVRTVPHWFSTFHAKRDSVYTAFNRNEVYYCKILQWFPTFHAKRDPPHTARHFTQLMGSGVSPPHFIYYI